MVNAYYLLLDYHVHIFILYQPTNLEAISFQLKSPNSRIPNSVTNACVTLYSLGVLSPYSRNKVELSKLNNNKKHGTNFYYVIW